MTEPLEEWALEAGRSAAAMGLQSSRFELIKARQAAPIPEGATYIGRGGHGHSASPLANRFRLEAFPDAEAAIAAYMRELALAVAHKREQAKIDEILALAPRLACWCCERPAKLLWSADALPRVPCHGDAVASLAEALEDERIGQGRRIGETTWTRSAALLYARAFGVKRALRELCTRCRGAGCKSCSSGLRKKNAGRGAGGAKMDK